MFISSISVDPAFPAGKQIAVRIKKGDLFTADAEPAAARLKSEMEDLLFPAPGESAVPGTGKRKLWMKLLCSSSFPAKRRRGLRFYLLSVYTECVLRNALNAL